MVLGLARTGIATTRFLASRGAAILASDARSANELSPALEALQGLKVTYRFGQEELDWLEGVDAVVPSPGVPQSNPLLVGARKRGIEVLSEIELASRFLETPFLAITGTNGKSTTTRLIGEMLEESGLRVFIGGNIGRPLIEFVDGAWDWGVVEVSSFQLEWVTRFHPRIALLLNLTADHLDRYDSLDAYGEAKARITCAQTKQDVAVLNRDDPWVWAFRERLEARVVSFGWSETAAGAFASGREIVWRENDVEERFSLDKVKLYGLHNVENLMAAIAAVKTVGIPARHVRSVMERFQGIEHRLEFVREVSGVRYYDDSKGTNVGAVEKSLASFDAPVILIAGGVDKGGGYRSLEALVRQRVKKLILLGAAAETIRDALGSLTDTIIVAGLDAAVFEAKAAAAPGDVVLLSPACSSFDMFENYAERGRAFKELVAAL
jgi:UDP-N-acetylmuramoylalanine--D-glutamate ligase